MLCRSDSASVVTTSLAAVFSLVFQDCAVQDSHQHLASVCFCSQASRDKDHVSTQLIRTDGDPYLENCSLSFFMTVFDFVVGR